MATLSDRMPSQTNSLRTTRRHTSSRYNSSTTTMEISQEQLGKSVDFDFSVDFGKSADLLMARSNTNKSDLNCSQDFHRSQEFGRDRTLSSQGSSSEDDRILLDIVHGASASASSGRRSSGRSKRRSKSRRRSKVTPLSYRRSNNTNDDDDNIINEQCPVTGHHSNILNDYYIFPTVLGTGHYGCVRECMSRSTRQFYAVKSIEKSKIGRLDHLQREVYLLSKINHGSIMKMVDIFEDVEFVHIVTEKYMGGELFDKIVEHTTEDGCLDEIDVAMITKQLLEAVAYLHRNGIVHRDVKPENLLFVQDKNDVEGDDLEVKLIDFGLARRHKSSDPKMVNPVGTAYYMSPELLSGRYDRACDVWSTGIVVYIMLCGYPPFNGDTDDDIFDSIKKSSFHFPSQAWGHISPEAKDFIKCLLRKDPKKRFTASEALKHPWIRNLDIYYEEQQLEEMESSAACNLSREEMLHVMMNLEQASIRH